MVIVNLLMMYRS